MVFNVNELMTAVEKLRRTISSEEMYFLCKLELGYEKVWLSSPDEDE